MPGSEYSEEILEVVDHRDRVIGTERRGVIHELGLMHRSAQVLVFNAAGQLFLQKRSIDKDEFPGLWDSSAAGHVNPGESYHECALRELNEELGIDRTEPLTRLFSFSASEATGYEHCSVFSCVHEGPMTLQAEEVAQGKWLTPAEMDRWVADAGRVMTPALCSIWRRYRAEEHPV